MVEINPYTPHIPKRKRLRIIVPSRVELWLVTVGMCYVASLPLPVVNEPSGDSLIGIACLIYLPWVLVFPAWYANVLFFAGVIALSWGKQAEAFALGSLATLLALSFQFLDGLAEWGTLGLAYYLWLASMVLLVLAALDTLRQLQIKKALTRSLLRHTNCRL